MQGIFVADDLTLQWRRPRSKKQVRETAAADPRRVWLEATSIFGNEYDGPLDEAPDGTYVFTGPEPGVSHKFYGNVVVKNDRITVK